MVHTGDLANNLPGRIPLTKVITTYPNAPDATLLTHGLWTTLRSVGRHGDIMDVAYPVLAGRSSLRARSVRGSSVGL